MTQQTEGINLPRLMLLAGVVSLAVHAWNNVSKPTPVPDPKPVVVASEVETANAEASQAMTRHLRDVIEQLESGKLTEERQTRDLLAAGAKAAQEAGWQPVKQKDVAAFADGWTPQKQIARLKAMIGE